MEARSQSAGPGEEVEDADGAAGHGASVAGPNDANHSHDSCPEPVRARRGAAQVCASQRTSRLTRAGRPGGLGRSASAHCVDSPAQGDPTPGFIDLDLPEGQYTIVYFVSLLPISPIFANFHYRGYFYSGRRCATAPVRSAAPIGTVRESIRIHGIFSRFIRVLLPVPVNSMNNAYVLL